MRVSSPTLWRLVYGSVVLLFTWIVAHYYIPGQGFTYLIEFGELNHSVYLPEVKAVNHFELPRSRGYDGQWYAQIAVHPNIGDPALNKSVDTLPYRARRILFSVTAWVLGAGDPFRVMNAYALQNIACWYLLAGLLLRWFPPRSLGNFFRWSALLFSFGLVFSVRGSLVDGPSLLLVAAGMALIESDRPVWAALLFGVSGLGKDTSVLSASALRFPDSSKPRARAVGLLQIALVLLPVLLWVLCLELWIGHGSEVGARNFSPPFSGFWNKGIDSLSGLVAVGTSAGGRALFDVLMLVGLLAQFLFFIVRIRWRDSWWRLGAVHAALMAFLGDSVWADYPSAAARVLLPMTLAFNVLVPRGRWWPTLLLLGNLGVLGSAEIIRSSMPDKTTQRYVVEGPSDLRFHTPDNIGVSVTYLPGNWWAPETLRIPSRLKEEYWRWSMGDGSISVHNPQPFTLLCDLSLGMATLEPRTVTVTANGIPAWSGEIMPARYSPISIAGLVLPPGDTVLVFHSDQPASSPTPGDRRRLAFSVRNLKIVLTGKR